MAALGGALVFGALPRVTKRFGRPRFVDTSPMLSGGILLALGLAMLATTRPYEGFMICLPAGAVFFHWLLSQRGRSLRAAAWQAAAPCAVLLGLTGAMMLHYQHRVTGHALESPYGLVTKRFRVSPAFVFQKTLPTPHYDNLEMRLLYVQFEALGTARMHDPYGFFASLKDRVTWYWQFFVGPLMTLPLLASVVTVRNRRLRLVWVSIFFLTLAIMLVNWIQVHYLAPGFCLFVLLLLQGARRLKILRLGRYAAGARVIRVLPVVCVLLLGLRVFVFSETDEGRANHWPPNWAYSTARLYEREQIEDALNDILGQHLVLVRYRYPFHVFHRELVYNGADLAGSKILWARSMDARQNCAFVQANGGRRLWVLDEWGDVMRFLPATAARICDPLNPIYDVNQPESYYFPKRASAAAGHGTGQPSTRAPGRPPTL